MDATVSIMRKGLNGREIKNKRRNDRNDSTRIKR